MLGFVLGKENGHPMRLRGTWSRVCAAADMECTHGIAAPHLRARAEVWGSASNVALHPVPSRAMLLGGWHAGGPLPGRGGRVEADQAAGLVQ